PVVSGFVPLVPDKTGAHGRDLPRCECRHARVPPEAELSQGLRDLYGVLAAAIDHEERSGQCVFRPATVGGRAESRISPRTGPDVGKRIDLGVRMCFLVADKRTECGS